LFREEDEDEKEEGKVSAKPIENTPKPTKLNQNLKASTEVKTQQSEEASPNNLKPVANKPESIILAPAQKPSKPSQKVSKSKKKTAVLA
jgi:hypothetical protein